MNEAAKFHEDLFRELFAIVPPWEIVKIERETGGIDHSPGKILFELAMKPGLVPCPECGRACKRPDTRTREWRDRDMVGWRTVLRAKVPRARCPKHGIRLAQAPWAERNARLTMRLETALIDDVAELSLAQAARKWGLSWDQRDGVKSRAVRRGLARRAPPSLAHLGIDETSFQKGQQDVTVVSDRARRKVLSVAEGRSGEALEPFYEQLGRDGCAGVKTVAMDMARGYLKVTREQTGAEICIDRFHVAVLLNKAVAQVLHAERKRLSREQDFRLKGTRYVWLKSPAKLSPERQRQLTRLRQSDLKVARAWALKERFRDVWNIQDPEVLRLALQLWRRRAMRSGLSPIKRAARTLKRHLEEIINACAWGVTNALAESLNSRIQWLKRQACGFRNVERFRMAIYFHLGKLDMYPRPEFHTKPWCPF